MMQKPPLRLVVLIAVAVVLAGLVIWQLAFPGEDDASAEPDAAAARIEELRRERNVAGLAKEVSASDARTARRAVAALGRIGSEAVQQVKQAMRDPRPRVREQAASSFAEVAQREDAAPLARLAVEDKSPNVRAAAVSGLNRMCAYDQMESLLAAMMDGDIIVRRRAYRAAKRFACVQVAYRADDPPSKRRAAVQQLRAEWLKHRDRARRYWEMILKQRGKLR